MAQRVKNPLAMWETWVQSLGWEDSLEEGMAAHSSMIAWRIPWTKEPGGLQSMGSQSQTGLSDEAQHSTFDRQYMIHANVHSTFDRQYMIHANVHSTFDRQYMIHANVSSHSLLFKIRSSIKEKFKWGTKEKSSKEKKDFLVTQLK